MPRYFTGKDVSSHILSPATATTFEALVTDLISMPVLLSVTREEYFKLPDAEQKKAKKAGYVVAATFPDDQHIRKLEHAGPCNLICLDIDGKPGDSPAAPFIQNPHLLREKLRWNFVAYKTVTSTDEAPRMRVIVDAAGIPPDRYVEAVLTVAQAMGLPYVTRESKVPHQPMYRPSVFQGQDVTEDHPLITRQFSGDTFKLGDIADDLDTLPGTAPSTHVNRVQVKGDAVEDWLTYFRLPLPQVDMDLAREILKHISPDCSRKEWIDVAMALRHQFPEDEAGAYDLFDKWSAVGTKYQGGHETVTQWKSVKEQPRGRAPVTIRTLLKMGMDAGWKGADKVREEGFQDVQKWLMFGCETQTQLTNEGIKRIAAAPLLSHTEEGMLLRTMVTQLKEKYHQSVGVTELKADLQKAKDATRMQKNAEKEIGAWACGWVFVTATKEFCLRATGQRADMLAFDAINSRYLLPTADDLQSKGQQVTQGALLTPICKPSLYVLNHALCRTVDDYDYDPSNPEEDIISYNMKRFLNTYRPSYKFADQRLADYAEEVFLDHLCNLVAEPELRTIILDWMAFHVQHPGEKVRWAILLQGAHGNGKTVIADALCAVLGDDNVNIINSNTLKKGWSEWGTGAQVVFMEEIRVTGKDRMEVVNSLKEPITNRRITINRRGVDTETAINRTNYMAFTNFHNAIPIEANDRRWCVIKSAIQNREQVAALRERDPQYFKRLHDMCETHAAGLRYFLENRTISPSFDPDMVLRTKYLEEMIHDTANELVTIISQIIEDAENPYVTEAVVAVGSMIMAMKDQGIEDVSKYQAATLLREMGYTEAGRHLVGTMKQDVWVRKDMLAGRNPLDILGNISKDATLTEETWI